MRKLGIVVVAVVVGGCSFILDSDKYRDIEELGPPTVDPVQSPTNVNPLPVAGTGSPGAFVEVRGGELAVASAEVAEDGTFSVDVALRANSDNTLLVTQVRSISESSAVMVQVTHDDIAPDTPFLDPVVSPTRRTESLIRGTAEAGSEVVVSGGSMEVTGQADDTGRFAVTVPLDTEVAEITQHDLSVTSLDEAGNESGPAGATIVHNPNLLVDAPLVDPVPGFVNQNPITISGLAEPDLTIQVTGGESDVTTTADSAGLFSVDVTLTTNSENFLNVFATITATGVTSTPFPVNVTHDDIAPESPSVDPVPSPTGAQTARLTGGSEGFATISVVGGQSVATATADAAGAYLVDVPLNLDQTNSLMVTATDRAGNAGPTTDVEIEQDSQLEDPVVVDPVATPTSTNPITISGSTQASVDVEIVGGASPVTVTSAGNGTFSTSVTLNANARNDLIVRRVGSSAETFVVVTHDDQAPDPPAVNQPPSPTNQTNIVVTGTTEPFLNVTITGLPNNASGTADDAGQFAIQVTLPQDSTSTLDVSATDLAGNLSNSTLVNVTHSSSTPDAPIVDDPNPPPTNQDTHVVTGRVTEPGPNITIDITGGAVAAGGPTNEQTGAFSIEVTLNQNAANSLSVTSTEGAITSPPSTANITHDNVAPAQPDGGNISIGTPTCIQPIRVAVATSGGAGAVEPSSVVRVLNEATQNSVTTTATASGSFSTTLGGCHGDQFTYTSTDAAGNVSLPLSIPVP